MRNLSSKPREGARLEEPFRPLLPLIELAGILSLFMAEILFFFARLSPSTPHNFFA